MSFRNFFKKDKSPATQSGFETKSLSGYSGGGVYDFLLGSSLGGYVTASDAMNFYRSSSSLAEAVDLIATEIEKIQPV